MWPSGLRWRSRKPLWRNNHRGFESHPLRHCLMRHPIVRMDLSVRSQTGSRIRSEMVVNIGGGEYALGPMSSAHLSIGIGLGLIHSPGTAHGVLFLFQRNHGSSPPLRLRVGDQWPLSGHGSLRGRRVPHDGVGSVGLVVSGARSACRRHQGRNSAHAMAGVPFRRGTPVRQSTLLVQRSRDHAACFAFADQRNSLPTFHMRCRLTGSLRVTAMVTVFQHPIGIPLRMPHGPMSLAAR